MTGAELVITASPWSLRNLGEPLGDIPIVDIAEVVAAAAGMEPPTWKG